MIRLFTSYYTAKTPERDTELRICLDKNVNNPLIDEIYLLIETGTNDFPIYDNKVTYIGGERPTFNWFFNSINSYASSTDISIVSNADIYFDESLIYVNKLGMTDCYALSRHEIDRNGKVRFIQTGGFSQDAWIFRGKLSELLTADFYPGIAGSDNRLAYEIKSVGYRIANPAETIMAYHVHKGAVNGYAQMDKSLKVPEPYVLLVPGTIEEVLGNHKKIQSRPLSFE